MGIDKENSVVDKNLRVHEVKNLFLGSNGVIPTGKLNIMKNQIYFTYQKNLYI